MKTRLFKHRPVLQRSVASTLVAAWLGFILCGCTTEHTWTADPATAPSELIKITGDFGDHYKIFIHKIDEMKTYPGSSPGQIQTVFVKPGEHTLLLQYVFSKSDISLFGPEDYNSFGSFSFGKVHFIAETGKAYIIHRIIDGYHTRFTVEDITTGKIVPLTAPSQTQSP